MRIVGVDYGFKRIGLAVAESEPRVITPRPALDASGTLKVDAAAIAAFARREEAALVVIGLPVEEDGNEGKMTRIVLRVAGMLRDAGLVVREIDERFSSVQAETNLRGEDLKASQRRRLRDGEAARIILERFFDDPTD